MEPDRVYEIHGVTARQKMLLDTMWSIKSHDGYAYWKSRLNEKTSKEVDVLEQCLMLEDIDYIVRNDPGELVDICNEVIRKAKQ